MPRSKALAGEGRAPRRTCVACRVVRAQGQLVRIAADGRGGVVVSPERGVGRGAYCCPTAVCLEEALRRKALPRALRCDLPRLDGEAVRRSFASAIERAQGRSLGSD